MINLLVALAPLILRLGLFFIDTFMSDQDDKKKAKQDFLNAIQLHLNDAVSSVNGRSSYASQDQALDQMDQKRDNPSAVNPAGPGAS